MLVTQIWKFWPALSPLSQVSLPSQLKSVMFYWPEGYRSFIASAPGCERVWFPNLAKNEGLISMLSRKHCRPPG